MQVVIDYIDGRKFVAQCGKHQVMIDLPAEVKGADEAANPPQYFLVSLASCIGVYVLSFCERSNLNPSGMKISINADKVTGPSRLDDIKIDINLPNAEVGKRKEALLAVAKQCLIHNTIVHHPKIEINLVSL